MKKRLDILVSEKENITREKAKALIMSGLVMVNEKIVDKPGLNFEDDVHIEVKEVFPYVSRGAIKLQKAADDFKIDFSSKVVCDVGASTGGFTDFALQNGASRVYAIDTGYGQIAQKLRDDRRVILMEKTNIKNVDKLPEPIDIFVIDVSFISLTKVLPKIKEIIISSNKDGLVHIVALIKPQFEVGKKIADKTRGVIKDDLVRLGVVEKIGTFAEENGFTVKGLTESPITGAKGNKEFLAYLTC